MNSGNWDVVVIGAGAAGLMAAIAAAERGKRTLVLEKNRKPGVKILMSGGTRCNITHDCDNRGIVREYGAPGKFLHSALAAFSVKQTIAFFEAEGVATKIEETGKVFPVSNKAIDVLEALLRRLKRSGATLALEEPVIDIRKAEDLFKIVTGHVCSRTGFPARPDGLARPSYKVATGQGSDLTGSPQRQQGQLTCLRVIVTTGGKSYPGSGTRGDGYAWAARFGHAIVPPKPALVPLTVEADWVGELRGVTLADVNVAVLERGRPLASRRGGFLFAHFGLSGPAPLDVSRAVSRHEHPQTLDLEIDLLPSKSEAELNEFFRTGSMDYGKKLLAVLLSELLPRRLCDTLLKLAGQSADRKAAGLSRPDRQRLVQLVKRLRIPLRGTLGFEKAEVTSGGVSLDEVDSRNMQSKLCSGLFLAGEVLDLDGPIGGYNFQAAWSTGWLAGRSV